MRVGADTWLLRERARLAAVLAICRRRGQTALMAELHRDHAPDLEAVRTLGRQLSELFIAQSMEWFASAYDATATIAEALLRDAYTQEDLNRLSAMTPHRPKWFDPRSPEYNLRREQWMQDAAPLEHEFRSAMLDLRVIGDAPTTDA